MPRDDTQMVSVSDGLNFCHAVEWIRRVIWPLADYKVTTMVVAQVCDSVRLVESMSDVCLRWRKARL